MSKPTLLECVLVERGDDPLLDDTATARVRRALLHGASLAAINIPAELNARASALIVAGQSLERVGYVVERKPRAEHGQGRAPVDYRVLNLEHVPTHEQPKPKPKARIASPSTRPSVQGTIRNLLLSGRVVSIDALRFEGCDIKPERFRKSVANTRLTYGLKTTRLPDGSYVLDGVAASKSEAVHVPASVPAPTSEPLDPATLPTFGGSLRVVGLQLDDDDNVRIALRNGVGTWVVSVEGYYVKGDANA